MALRYKFRHHIWEDFNYFMGSRFYRSKVDWNKLRPVILKRIEERDKENSLKRIIGVAKEVIRDRALLFEGVSTLLKYVPIKACKLCPEVYIGEKGHLIENCHGYRRRVKNQVHEWTDGSLNDILVPVEAFHMHRFQDIINHDQRSEFDRIPAVLELCSQAGADVFDQSLHFVGKDSGVADMSILPHDLRDVAIRTLMAWENMREGVQRLLLVYPAKVCKHCSEVHVGRSGHKAIKCKTCRGAHFWKTAEVDNLVPPKIVWHRRNQDPPILLDKGRDFYGHAPAVVELCVQAGAPTLSKYFCMMKLNGLAPPI